LQNAEKRGRREHERCSVRRSGGPKYMILSISCLTKGPTMPTIDEYSIAAIPIQMLFNATELSIGTAFI
jgi:hypothetical protein